jgi:hypothetical protein
VALLSQRNRKRIDQPDLSLSFFFLLNDFQQWRKNISHFIQPLNKAVELGSLGNQDRKWRSA